MFATLSRVPIKVVQILIYKELIRKYEFQREKYEELYNHYLKNQHNLKSVEDKIKEFEHNQFQREHNSYFDSEEFIKECKREMESLKKNGTIFEKGSDNLKEVFEYWVFDKIETIREKRKETLQQAINQVTSFQMSESEFKATFGTEADFQRVVASKLVNEQKIKKMEEAKEKDGKEKNYPPNCTPTWEIIKSTLKGISQTIELVGKGNLGYTRISLSHIYLLLLILSLKRRINDKKMKFNESKLTIFHSEIMLLMQCLEIFEMETSKNYHILYCFLIITFY